MTVYPFGEVSSSSYVNFFPKQTSANHLQELDTKTVETVKKNFYVGDRLNFISIVETAISVGQRRVLSEQVH